MILDSVRSLLVKGSAVLVVSAVALAVTGCGMGSFQSFNGSDVTPAMITGNVHGGLNPIQGATVTLYATTSSGYGGTATQLATTTTNSSGVFQFTGAATCPAGQFAYIVAYGGNTGAQAANPNSILMAAVGPCGNLTTNTFALVDELTTVAAAYALSNFITISGNAVSGYTVNITSSGTNNSAAANPALGTGCVHNSYYGSNCLTTATNGLSHAFSNAANLVSISNGQVVASPNTNGAVIPVALFNTLGNVLQACVNSTGGGTSGGTGAASTTTSPTSTTTDGTACGNLSAYTSYTTNGTTSGTVVASGNTLGMMVNLAKRPTGSPSTSFTNGASTVCSGTAVSCIFALSSASSVYQSALATAPPDFSIAIYYPKASLNTATNSVVCTGSSTITPANNGLVYPFFLATDINDNIVIANGEQSTNNCLNIIVAGFDGTPIAASTFDNSGPTLSSSIAVDSFGHAIVPVHGSGSLASPSPNNGVRVYSYDPTAGVQLLTTYEDTTGTANPLFTPEYVGVDQNDTIWIAAQNSTNGLGWLTLSGANSHSSPVYTSGNTSTVVSSSNDSAAVDFHGNVFFTAGSSSGGERVRVIAAQVPSGTTNAVEAASTAEPGNTTTTSNGVWLVPDTNGNTWTISSGTGTDTSGTGVASEVFSTGYNTSSGTFTSFATTGTLYPGSVASEYDFSVKPGSIDGNGVIWWPDNQGSATATTPTSIYAAYLHGFDTGSISAVTPFYLPIINGCQFAPSVTYSIASSVIGASSTVFTMTTTGTPPAAGGTITLSGFPGTSSFYTGSVTVASNTIGAGAVNSTFTVNSNFGQGAGSDSDAGTATAAADSNHCGSIPTDGSYPSNQAYSFYGSRGLAVDSAGDIWVVNGTIGRVTEVIGLAAPTWPLFIHNGVSNKP